MGRSLVNTNREILQLAVPSIITNITVPLLGLVDLAIVGHIGNETYIAAISVGTMIFNVMYWLCGFLRMGTSGMTAQAYGKGKKMQMELLSDRAGTTDEQSVIDKSQEGLRTTLHSSMRFAWMIALAMLLLQVPLQWLMLWLMGPSAEVDELVRVYFHICIWGAPAMLSLYVLTGWFIGMQDTRTPMIVSVMQNLVNIAMSLLFVIVFGMKIEGVALGTLVAQWCGALWAVIMLKRKYGWALKKTTDRIRMVSRRELRVNGDLFFRTFCLVAVNLFFTSAGARQGDLILSVNTLLMTFFTLFSYVMDGFAFAGEALAGKYYGANDDASLRKVWHHLFLWGGGIAILFTAVYAMGGVAFLSLLTDSAVRDLLYRSDALVLASRSEVQPLVLLEAMSTGIPVIATTCVPQSLRLQDGCRIVAIDDVDGLSAAMAVVMIQTVDGQQLSQQVREMASPEVIGRQLVSLFEGLIASN